MDIIEHAQGSAAWLAHRATHFNASDAPAMMGCSPYKTRTQLIHEVHTGLTPDVDAAMQRRFDDGHRFEALARPLAEQIVGEDLYPVVGTKGKLSASFDGLTFDESTGFEHKTLNDQLRAALMSDAGADALPLAYRVQMEQQCMVSGASRILFMASKWAGEELVGEMHAWYEPDAELRAQILAGWEQFEKDVAAYVPKAASAAEKVVAEAVEALPAPVARVTGELAVIDNFREFEERLGAFLGRLIRDPKTDQDFVNLDAQIKEMKLGRESLKQARAQLLAQVQPIDRADKTAAMLDKLLQENCSMAERLLKDEKERRRGEIITAAAGELKKHVEALNARLGRPYMPQVPADFGGVVRGLKSLASMEDKVEGELTRAKIAASAWADRIDVNLKHLAAEAGEFLALFPDVATIVTKAADDFAALVQFRVSEQRTKDRQRAERLAEQERQRIAEEERVKAEAKVRAEAEARDRAQREEAANAAAEQRRRDAEALAAAALQTAAAPPPSPTPITTSAAVTPLRATPITRPAAAAPAADAVPTLTLGQIKERLSPIQITADGLATLGFEGTHKGASVLFHEQQFPQICEALVAHIHSVLEDHPA